MSVVAERALVFDCFGDACLGVLHESSCQASTVGVLVVVGGPQYRVGSHRQFVLLARHLASKGFPVMRFDYRGMGDSGGEPRDFRQVEPDIRAAVDAFMHHVPQLRSVVIFGLCDAASAALMYCGADSRLAGLILANPWVRTEVGLATVHVKHYYAQRFLQGSFWRKIASGRLDVLSSLHQLLRALGVAARGRNRPRSVGPAEPGPTAYVTAMEHGLRTFGKPVLFLISGRDLTAREFTDLCGSSEAWASLLRRPGIKVETLREADHTFSSRTACERANGLCAHWLSATVLADSSRGAEAAARGRTGR